MNQNESGHQEHADGRAGLVRGVERLYTAVRGVEMSAGDESVASALLGDLRVVLARFEAPAPRLGGVFDAQEQADADADARLEAILALGRLYTAVRGVEMSAGDEGVALALLVDLRAILARSESPVPRV